MAKCVNCGAELPEGARFCRNCGTRVEIPELRPEVLEQKKEEIEATALSLRELSDKMIASFVTGMKDFEGSLEKVRKEAEAKVADAEKKFADKASKLLVKDKEYAELSDKFKQLQSANQKLQAEKAEAQNEIASLKARVAALETAASKTPAAQQSAESK